MAEVVSGALTPGRVFCSWRALWAFSADSLAQYVRKAHPAVSQRQEKEKLLQHTVALKIYIPSVLMKERIFVDLL